MMSRSLRRAVLAGLLQIVVLSALALAFANYFGRTLTPLGTVSLVAVLVLAGHVYRRLRQPVQKVNRAPPRTQAALLEAMQERQVTVEGATRRLDPPFVVLATANPIEYEGTYQLPEAQLDRCLLRVSFGYLEPEQEWEVLSRRIERRREEITLDPVTDAAGLLAMQAAVEQVPVEALGRYMVELAAATRSRPEVLVGASPRGAVSAVAPAWPTATATLGLLAGAARAGTAGGICQPHPVRVMQTARRPCWV
jgi:hypothetical protein